MYYIGICHNYAAKYDGSIPRKRNSRQQRRFDVSYYRAVFALSRAVGLSDIRQLLRTRKRQTGAAVLRQRKRHPYHGESRKKHC